jgi:hypothetical protein
MEELIMGAIIIPDQIERAARAVVAHGRVDLGKGSRNHENGWFRFLTVLYFAGSDVDEPDLFKELAQELSQTSDAYDEADFEVQWKSIGDYSGAKHPNLGTLATWAKGLPWDIEPDRNNLAEIVKVEYGRYVAHAEEFGFSHSHPHYDKDNLEFPDSGDCLSVTHADPNYSEVRARLRTIDNKDSGVAITYANGKKNNAKGTKLDGCFCVVSKEVAFDLGKLTTVMLTEGLRDAARIVQLLEKAGRNEEIESGELAVLYCVNAGNLPKTAKAFHERLPAVTIIHVVDNDKAGKAAAKAVQQGVPGALFVFPAHGKDFNDWGREDPEAALQGLDARDWRPEEESLPATVPPLEGEWQGAGEPLSEVPDYLQEMNQRYYPVQVGREMLVAYQEESMLDHATCILMKYHDFKNKYCNKPVVVGFHANGNPIMKAQGEAWLTHPLRNANRKLVFDPERLPGGEEKSIFNLYQGWPTFGDATQGDPEPMLEHIREVICCGESLKYDYLIRWLAYCVQYPWRRPEVAVVLQGVKGCGKGTIGQTMVKLFGAHGLQVSNRKHVTGQFNGHMATCLYMFADESFFVGNKEGEAVLKAIITEPFMMLERKGIDAVQMANMLALMMAANEDHIINATTEERRFSVFGVSPHRVNDIQYFVRLAEWRENGNNLQAFLAYLQNVDLDGFNPRVVPQTRELAEQRFLSLDGFESWFVECLSRESFTERDGEWGETVTIEALAESFNKWCDQMRKGTYDRLTREAIGKRLQNKLKIKRRQLNAGEYVVAKVDDGLIKVPPADHHRRNINRPWIYVMGTVDERRQHTIELLKLPPDHFRHA